MIARLAAALLLAAALHAERLRVATYNLENYNLSDRRTADGFARNAPKPERQKDALRAVLRAMNADLVALQEIGGPGFTEELRRDLAAEGLEYPHAVTLEGPDPHRRIAFLSKRPFTAVDRRARVATGFDIASPGESIALSPRGLLRVSLSFGGATWRISTLHLKSRLTRDKSDPRAERERRAEIAALLREAGADGAPELLLGDFNDGPNSATISAVTRAGFTRLVAPDSRGESWTYRNDTKGLFDPADDAFLRSAPPGAAVTARAVDHPKTRDASDHRPVLVEIQVTGDSRIAPAR